MLEPLTTDGLHPIVMDLFQILGGVIAIGAAIFGASRALHEARESRKVRTEELRWRKAQLAKETLAEFRINTRAQHAATMLDWSGRPFEVAPGVFKNVPHEEMARALRVTNTTFDDKERFVRGVFRLSCG